MMHVESTILELLESEGIDVAQIYGGCRFGELTTRALGRFAHCCTDYDSIKNILDEYSVAEEDINNTRADAEFLAADLQRTMRRIQARHHTEGIKPTLWERSYKADPKHMELEAALAKAKAVVNFCDSSLTILNNRFFILNAELRQLPMPHYKGDVC